MSRGPGRIQRELELIFDGEQQGAFTTEDLCGRIYGKEPVNKSRRVAVIRAAKAACKTHPGLDWARSEGRGSELIFFHHDNIMSYGMAQLKSDCFQRHYDEKFLRKRLADQKHRSLTSPGGAWWLAVQTWIAQKSGDKTKLKELEPFAAAQRRKLEGLLAQLGQG